MSDKDKDKSKDGVRGETNCRDAKCGHPLCDWCSARKR